MSIIYWKISVIIKEVCSYYAVDPNEIFLYVQTNEARKARQVCHLLTFEFTTISKREAAQVFRRETLNDSISTCLDVLQVDKVLRREVEEIRNNIKNIIHKPVPFLSLEELECDYDTRI